MPTLASVNAQRSAAGVKTVAKPLSTREVQAQSQYQNQVRAQNILSNAVAETYIDQQTGRDSRTFDDTGNPVAGTGSLTTIRGGNAIGDVNGTLRGQAMQGATSQYKEAPEATIMPGAIAQNRFDRLVASGMTPAAAAEKTNDTSGIKDAFNQVGTGTRPAPGIATPNPSKEQLADRDKNINGIVGKKLVTQYDKEGNPYYVQVEDPELTAQLREAQKNRYLEEDKMTYDKYKSSQDLKQSLTPDVIAETESHKQSSTGRVASDMGFSAVDAAPPEIQDLFARYPEFANVYEPLVEALARDDRQQASFLMSTLARIDKQGDNAAKVAQDAIAASKDYHNKLAEMSKSSHDIQMDIAEEQKKQADFDRAHYEHQQGFIISQKIEQAAEDEMIRRRQAAGQGFTSDTSGLGWMQKEARKAQDSIDFLKSETNMVSAEMSRRASETYSLSVRQLGQQYDETLLKLDNSLSSSISEIQSTLNMGDEQRAQAYEGAYQGYLDKVSKNDIEMARMYSDIVKTVQQQAFDIKKLNMQEDRADKRTQWQEEQADKKMRFQESQLDKRLMYSESQANKRLDLELQKMGITADRQAMQDEKKESEGIRTDFRQVGNSTTVKEYKNSRNATDKAIDILQSAIESGNKLDLGVATEVLGVLYEKSLDPNSVVREGEYQRAGLAQGVGQKVEAVLKALSGGDMTGISKDTLTAFQGAMQTMTQSMKSSAMSEFSPAINRLIEFNNSSEHIKLDPRTILQPEFIEDTLLNSYFDSTNSAGYNYDYGSYSTGVSSSSPSDAKVVTPMINALPATGMSMDEIVGDYSGLQLMSTEQSRRVIDADFDESAGDILSSFGPITQSYSTPISDKNYASSTVKAWGGKHLGLDIAMPAGAYIPSLTEGTLMSVEYSKDGWGLSAIVKAPDGAEVRYSHLMSIDPRLTIGGEIMKGEEFAQVGNTGNVFSNSGGDGTHLDFRIRKDGKYIDPFSYIS